LQFPPQQPGGAPHGGVLSAEEPPMLIEMAGLLNCFSTSVVPHWGHRGCSLFRMRSSKWAPHFSQVYS